RVPAHLKVDRTFATWRRHRFTLRAFVRGLVLDDQQSRRVQGRRRALLDVLNEPDVKAVLGGMRQAQARQEEEAYIQRVDTELQSLVGLSPFHQWSVTAPLDALSLPAAIATIQRVAPTWTRLFERLTHNRHDASSAEHAMAQLSFQRQLLFITTALVRSKARRNANFFGRVLGMALIGAGALRATIELLNGAGICDSYPAVNESWKLVAKESQAVIRRMARDPQVVVAYDNLNFLETVRDHALGSSRANFTNVTTGLLVRCPSLPPHGLTMSMLDRQHQLQLLSVLAPAGLRHDSIARAAARFFIKQAIVTVFEKALAKAFENAGCPAELPAFPYVRRIPAEHGTALHPLAGIFSDEGTIDGTYDVHRNIFIKQMGFSDDANAPDFTNRLILAYGDQKTAAYIRSLKYEQRLSSHPYDRREWLIGPPALFHTAMALLYTITRTHFDNPPGAESKSTLLHDIRYWARTRITRENIKYHDLKPVVVDGFNARMLAVLYDVLQQRQLVNLDSEYAGGREKAVAAAIERLDAESALSVINEIEARVFTKWADTNVDPECTTFARLCRKALIFMTFEHAVAHGDVGMLERLIYTLPVLFFGAGQNKYGLEMLHLCWLLEASAPELKEAILCGGLVTQVNAPGMWKPIDLAVEHLNLTISLDMKSRRNSTHDTKATFARVASGTTYNTRLQRQFEALFSYHTDRSHTRKDVTQDLLSLSFHLQKEWPCWRDEAQDTRRRYQSPDIIKEGLRVCETKVDSWNAAVRQGRVAAAAGGGHDEAIETNIMEMTEELALGADAVEESTMGI
ncbi:hypothetical protein KEM52_000555, partial [Ascosphaera acerosa]